MTVRQSRDLDSGPAVGTEAPAASPAGPDEAELPAGTVTFLLTDIDGSTRLWEVVPEAMEVALERHNRLLTGVIEDHGGVVVTSARSPTPPASPNRPPISRRPAATWPTPLLSSPTPETQP